MITKFITFSVFIILLLSVTPVLAQQDPYNGYFVQHFTDENGLPQNTINDLLFDNEGYLWLGSQVGLVRFNGYSFKLFYPDDKPAMESNVQLLGKNDQGYIYFQTDDHNLYCYPGNNSHLLSPINTYALKKPHLLSSGKRLFDFSSFLGGAPPGKATEKRKLIFKDLFEHNRNFYVVDSTHTYLLYSDTLYYYDNKELSKVSVPLNNALEYLILEGKLYILNKDSVTGVYGNGKLLKGAEAIGGDLLKDAFGRDAAGWEARGQDITAQGGKDRGLKKSAFRLFSSGNINHLLAGNRLYRIYPGPGGVLTTRFLLDIGFATNITGVEYNPGLDLLLIATETEGFYSLRKSRFELPGFSPPLRQHLSKHLFGPLALLDESIVLTDKFSFDAAGKFNLFRDSTPIWQRCLFIDKKNNVWSAIYNLPRKLTTGMEPAAVFPALDGQIVDYKEDEDGHLYCLTEKSLWRLETDSFRRLFNKEQLSVKGTNESLCMVAPHLAWIAGYNGLLQVDTRSNEAGILPPFIGAHVRSIYKCRDGGVLVGTYGQGYYYYHKDRFFRMPLDKNGFLITAHCFLEDKKDNIWIPCNKGLFKIPKADMDAWCDSESHQVYYYYYGRQDGLRTNEFNGGFNGSGVITRDGFVALLSMKGMVCFYTDSLKSEFPRGNLDITNIEIDGKWGSRTDSIELPPDYNSLLVEISCPYLGNRNNLYLEYSLKGLNDEWKEVPEDGILNLSRLGPGNYTLRVRKVNGFGRNNYTYREWNIVVAAHFYRTTWFILLAGLVLLLLLTALVQLRLKLIEKQKEVRVKAEKLKGTVIALEKTVKKLQESERALLQTSKVREKLISLVIHDLRSPLRFLTMLAGNLHDNLADLSPEEIKERTYWVKKGTNDIYNFSEDFLLWVTSQKNNFSIAKRPFPLRPLLQEIYDFFLEQVQQKGNSIFYEAGEELTIYSDPHILITIIRNLVDNANKYTDKGKITISACKEEAHILILVSDTGRGMSPQQVESFLQNDSLDDVKTGSQLGHKFIFDLTKRIHGAVSIDSREQMGTTVKLRFPA
jgi:signal transduction histidine kinase